MRSSKKIIWIDDNPDRASTAEEDLGATFISVKGKDLAIQVSELFKGSRPGLIVLDHVLDKTATEDPMFQKGSTIAGAIKEKWPFCPVIGITNMDNLESIDLRTRESYDALFPFYHFGKYINRIEAIRNGFALIIKTKAKTPSKLVKLLKPPKDCIERLIAALPDKLKEKEYSNDASVASRLHQWVNQLIDRPGFLYDQLWAATYLGLNEVGFEKVSGQFERALYHGVFSNDQEPRWWADRLGQVLYRIRKPEVGEMSWQTGRRLSSIKKEHFSRCYVCRDNYPETVAFLDLNSSERRAMHLKCTVLHPHYKRELYFEDIRVMQGS